MLENVRACEKMQENARKCKKVQEGEGRCKKMQENARKCKKMQGNVLELQGIWWEYKNFCNLSFQGNAQELQGCTRKCKCEDERFTTNELSFFIFICGIIWMDAGRFECFFTC